MPIGRRRHLTGRVRAWQRAGQKIPLVGDNALLAFDFLRFGLSDKPRRHRYSLFWLSPAINHLRPRSVTKFIAVQAPVILGRDAEGE
jgi:hypothetical protein